MPTASIVVPTRDRADYLDVALASIVPQAREAGADVFVVLDGPDVQSGAVAERHGARWTAYDEPRGLNAARNTGAAATEGELVVFVDDDVEAPGGWLGAFLAAAEAEPGADAFGGPIRARLEGCRLPMCGREAPPVTTLDLGPADRDAERAWGANMAIRRAALERVGPFDADLGGAGDEEEWQARLRAAGGRIRYVAAAGLDHRRARPDTTLRALARAAHVRGRNTRRFDVRRGDPPCWRASCACSRAACWHTARRRCAQRTRHGGALRGAGGRGRSTRRRCRGRDFLSGAQRHRRRAPRRRCSAYDDALLDARDTLSGRRTGLARAARTLPPRRRVLVAGVDRPELDRLMGAARAELGQSRHDVEFAIAPAAAGRGKFENLNALLAAHPARGHDWLLVVDDDVVLPRALPRCPALLRRALRAADRPAGAPAALARRLARSRAAAPAAWRARRRSSRSAR